MRLLKWKFTGAGLACAFIALCSALSFLGAQEGLGPEDIEWGLDSGKKSDTTTDAKSNSSVPESIRRHIARQYAGFRKNRLNKNRNLRPELLRRLDAKLAKAYAALMTPRSSRARARGRIEAGLEGLLTKISRKIPKKHRIVRATLEKTNANGGEGNVVLRTPEGDGDALDLIIFVYRVEDNGSFESNVTYRPGL